MNALQRIRQVRDAAGRSSAVFLGDVGHGLLEVSHNTLALVGLAVVTVSVFAVGQPEMRKTAEQHAYSWLQARLEVPTATATAALLPVAQMPQSILTALAEPDAIARATATNPKELTRQQASVAQWLSRRYRVAAEPVSRLVKEAWSVGNTAGLDPTLILAIMAIESSFNPFAQSTVGAQGLMQVMTRVHDDKYEAFGGNFAAFDPVTNLRVGVQVLKECISRAGGLEAGLRHYVGAANLEDDGGYAGRVLAEQSRLKQVANGRSVPIFTPATPKPAPAVTTVEAKPPAAEQSAAQTADQLALLR